jgi:eukaryotic-like serine/threonine-protein kinase
MATAGINRMMLWTDLENREIEGRWHLRRLVRPEGRAAWFEATGADGRLLMLGITETLNDDEEMVARLRAAAAIRDPHLVELHEAIATHIDDAPAVVAAMEWTDENLGDVLRERTLTPAEARVVMEALIQGLAAIHARGLVHGRMEPASVLAIGATIKLRSDCLYPGGAGFAAAAAENVRALGRIVTQSVTRRAPAGENDPVLQLLPEPMARVIRRALSGNAKIEEVAALASMTVVPAKTREADARPAPAPGPIAVSPKTPAVMPGVQAAELAVRGECAPQNPASVLPAREKPSIPAGGTPASHVIEPAAPARVIPIQDAPARTITASMDQRARTESESGNAPARFAEENVLPRDRRRSVPWVIGAAVIITIAAVWAVYAMVHRSGSAKPSQPAAAVVPGPQKSSPTPVRPGLAASRGATPGTAVIATPGWRVVAYTYNHEAQAEHKAQVIAQRFPQLAPGVYAPHGKPPYLVTLGGVMTRPDAFALRDRAVRMGLPRDTYAQNYR